MDNIEMRKPKAKRLLGQPAPSPVKKRPANNYPRRSNSVLTTQDIDMLAEITNGNCRLVKLMRKPVQQKDEVPEEVSSFVEVETTATNLPKTVQEVVDKSNF